MFFLSLFYLLPGWCNNVSHALLFSTRRYVKVYLLPDRSRSGKRKTKVCKGTLNPVFNEKVRFNLTMEHVDGRSIWLTVWHSDRFGRNDFLGEVTLPLGRSLFDHTDLKWYPLQDKVSNFIPTVFSFLLLSSRLQGGYANAFALTKCLSLSLSQRSIFLSFNLRILVDGTRRTNFYRYKRKSFHRP